MRDLVWLLRWLRTDCFGGLVVWNCVCCGFLDCEREEDDLCLCLSWLWVLVFGL